MTKSTIRDSLSSSGQRTVDGKQFNLLWADGWQGAFPTQQALDVLDELERKAVLVQAGLDQFTKAERFAYEVLLRHHRMTCGGE